MSKKQRVCFLRQPVTKEELPLTSFSHSQFSSSVSWHTALGCLSNIQSIEFLLDLLPYLPRLISNVYFKCILTNSLIFICPCNFNTITENPLTLTTPSSSNPNNTIFSHLYNQVVLKEKLIPRQRYSLTPVSIKPLELLSHPFTSQWAALIAIPVAAVHILGLP